MSSPNSYPLNAKVRAWTTFQQRTSAHTAAAVWALYDPTGVGIKVTDPAGVQQVYTYPSANVAKEATGVYLGTFVVASVGDWFYEWYCDDGRKETKITVLPTHN